MLVYILRRLAQSVFTIMGVMLLTFLLFRGFAGDIAAAHKGKKATERVKAEWRHKHGYDRPLVINLHRRPVFRDLTEGTKPLLVRDPKGSNVSNALALISPGKPDDAEQDHRKPARQNTLIGRYVFWLSDSTPLSKLTNGQPLVEEKPERKKKEPATRATTSTAPTTSSTAPATAPAATTAPATGKTRKSDKAAEPETVYKPVMVFVLSDGSELPVNIDSVSTCGELTGRVNDNWLNRDKRSPLGEEDVKDWPVLLAGLRHHGRIELAAMIAACERLLRLLKDPNLKGFLRLLGGRTRLAKAEPATPVGQVWRLLDGKACGDICLLPDGKDPDEKLKASLLAALNKVLGKAGLYDPAAWPDPKLDEKEAELLRRLKRGELKDGDARLVALNRALLAVAMPHQIAAGADDRRIEAAISRYKATDLIKSQFFHHLVNSVTFQGRSLQDNRKLTTIIADHAPASLSITVPAMVIGWLVGLVISCFVAYYRGGLVDRIGVFVSVLGMCIPFLAFMIIGQWLMFEVAPRHAYGTFYRVNVYLPITIMVIAGLGRRVRFYRTVLLDETNRDYVRTARAKGVPLPGILFKHVLKNCMLPILTSLIMAIPFLIMGSLLVETYFGIPGLGDLMLTSINTRNEPILSGLVFMTAVIYVLAVLLTDLSYSIFDPRIRLR